MKLLRIILISLISLIAVVLVAALIAPRDYEVETSVEISDELMDVFDYVVLLKNQDAFSVWSGMDPKMQKTFTGTDGTVGFISAWTSEDKNVGRGEQEITGIDPYKKIDYELRFIEPFESTNDAWIKFESTDNNTTRVMWGIKGEMSYPMNLMIPLMSMNKKLEKDLSQGLDNLKVILEN